jgi:hypothetical protein
MKEEIIWTMKGLKERNKEGRGRRHCRKYFRLNFNNGPKNKPRKTSMKQLAWKAEDRDMFLRNVC